MSHRTLLLLVLLYPTFSVCQNYCYSTDKRPYLLFGTKTAYNYTHGNLNQDTVPQSCTPLQLWSFNRHGTRYPDDAEIEAFSNLGSLLKQVVANYEQEKTSLCKEDFNLLKTWKWDTNIAETVAKDLTEQGFEDLSGIAKRQKEKFPDLFEIPYEKKSYYFQCSNSDRAKDSFIAYVKELFGSDEDIKYKQSNKVIKEYKKCESWQNENYKNEYERYIKTSLYRETAKRISQRLGFSETLNASTIETIYLACAFEKAWYVDEISKWCTAFTYDDLLILEYAEDLKSYYKSGYGREKANKALGCPILQDLLTHFQDTISNSRKKTPKVVVQFSHSASVNQLLVNLELYKDYDKLTADNYLELTGRKWRSSLFGPFASNVAAVLYNCADTEDPYQIELFVDERPVEELCLRGKLCSWKEFYNRFKIKAKSCNLDFCKTA